MAVSEHLIFSCLLGGATGDALGAEIEFWSLPRIRSHFPDGLQKIPPHDGMVGAITDDTQRFCRKFPNSLKGSERWT